MKPVVNLRVVISIYCVWGKKKKKKKRCLFTLDFEKTAFTETLSTDTPIEMFKLYTRTFVILWT